MKELGNKIIVNAHVFILLYGLWATYGAYEEHSMLSEQISTQIPLVESEIVINKKKVKEIQEAIKKTDEFKLRVEEVARSIETAQKQLPPEINDTQILGYFNKEMELLNLKDANIAPGSEVTSTYFISKDYTLKAKGTFLQFLIFFERIGNATRIYNVKSLKLAVSNDPQKGRFQIIQGEGVIQAFRYNPDFRVDRGFSEIESKFPVKP